MHQLQLHYPRYLQVRYSQAETYAMLLVLCCALQIAPHQMYLARSVTECLKVSA